MWPFCPQLPYKNPSHYIVFLFRTLISIMETIRNHSVAVTDKNYQLDLAVAEGDHMLVKKLLSDGDVDVNVNDESIVKLLLSCNCRVMLM